MALCRELALEEVTNHS